MGAVDIIIFIGAALFLLGRLLKLIRPRIQILGSTLPWGTSMVLLDVGLALKARGY